MPEPLRTLDREGLVVEPGEVPGRPDVLVCCDTSSPERLGSLIGMLDEARAVLVLDHHASFTGFGSHHLVDPAAPATAALVRDVVGELGVPLDRVMARALFAGLYTDTGGFRYGGADSLRLGAELVDAGVEPKELLRGLSGEWPFGWLAALDDPGRCAPGAGRGRWRRARVGGRGRRDRRPVPRRGALGRRAPAGDRGRRWRRC